MKLYLVAGEHSGDALGAELMHALRELNPAIQFTGAGGPKMKALAGAEFIDWADEAVVGLWDVLKKYGYFKAQFDRMLAAIAQIRPDAVIFIDYPGFNLRLAKALRQRHSTLPIHYYISPQVWAWNRRRIPQMARCLNLMLCIFPFEQPLYEKSGLHTVFVGHPIIHTLAPHRIDTPRDERLAGLFPGSRRKEVTKHFPTMLQAAIHIQRRLPGFRAEVAAASEELAAWMSQHVAGQNLRQKTPINDWLTIQVGNAYQLMQRATAGIVCSGTATLEAAYFQLPMAIIYKVAWPTWIIGKCVVKVPFLGMPNILAQRRIIPEYLQTAAQPEALGEELWRLLTDSQYRAIQQQELQSVINMLGEPGAPNRAAQAILQHLPTPS